MLSKNRILKLKLIVCIRKLWSVPIKSASLNEKWGIPFITGMTEST